jgi:hypothetical protein
MRENRTYLPSIQRFPSDQRRLLRNFLKTHCSIRWFLRYRWFVLVIFEGMCWDLLRPANTQLGLLFCGSRFARRKARRSDGSRDPRTGGTSFKTMLLDTTCTAHYHGKASPTVIAGEPNCGPSIYNETLFCRTLSSLSLSHGSLSHRW